MVLGLALVAGCSDEPKAGTIRPPRPTPTTSSASPTPATPEAQIKATMRAYMVAANEMFTSGDVKALRAFSVRACPCREITRYVERVANRGGEFRGAAYKRVVIRVHGVDAGTGLAEVSAQVPPYKVFDGKGKVIENSPGGKLHTDFSLVQQPGEGRWIIGNAVNLG